MQQQTPAPAVTPPAPALPAAPPAPAPDTASAPAPITPAPAATAPPAEPVTTATPTPPADTPAPAASAPLPTARPTVSDGLDATPAKTLFSRVKLPSLGKALAIGYYPRGCLSGGVELPVNGPTWQVMRLSRNRNWGHPELVHFLERFAPLAAKATGWKGILVGDMAQPRGGPLPFGHLSHQIGLDVDIWFMPMPAHTLSNDEREKTSAINLVSDDWKHINPKTWTPQHIAFIRTAAEQPGVERVLVNAAIKKELCRVDNGKHSSWLDKVRPWYGHHDHIHVRMKCPADSPNCRKQPPVPGDDGCSASALDYWFSDKVLHPKPKPPGPPPRPLMLSDLPPACKTVVSAPARDASKTTER
ncbi:penicillin-insensitive murein endopeptidase [Pseudolabrys taiwanensis]|uniref:penicillin-insensitive murein endopeptidase n=1 Tax=Pseudolabrys taiwanensis TaxID=331696 RepID=UPI001AECFB54|nr:penicillin-insensitive murein endopeptidase [Pseudolabrys taiwanensis]